MLSFRQIKSIAFSPSLLFRQLASVVFYSFLGRWEKFPQWLIRHSLSSIPSASGARGMGCIGFPSHPVWEVTSACNLKCIHCHASTFNRENELSTVEGKKLIDELARIKEFKMLVFTGGEPLVRPDLFELLHHARKAGFINVLATNGTLIDFKVACALKKAGVHTAAVSIDSCREQVHNEIRKNELAFRRATEGIEALKKAGLKLQVNLTVMEHNLSHLEEIIECAERMEAGILLVYQLVPVGRGNSIKFFALDKSQNEFLLQKIARLQKKMSLIIEPVAGPQYWPYLIEKRHQFASGWKKYLARKLFFGCSAGRGFVYIKPDGNIWACPFLEESAGSSREQPFDAIWRESPLLNKLRTRETLLGGKCGRCQYQDICGGCRGRAMAYSGDLLAEDPSCFIEVEM